VDIAVAEVERYEQQRPAGIYLTLNPVKAALLARANNKIRDYQEPVTTDVLRRQWLPIDIDVTRPAGISASEGERMAAIDAANTVEEWLSSKGWPRPLIGDSGNGYWLLYRIELPNDDDTTQLIKHTLEAISASLASDIEPAQIDKSVFNAARICRLFGTMNRKGEDVPERPHRCSELFETKEEIKVVTHEQLEAVACLAPAPAERNGSQHPDYLGRPGRLDVARWLTDRGREFTVKRKGDGTLYLLAKCPFDPTHGDHGEVHVGQFDNGALSFCCKHNSCQGKTWQHAKQAIGAPDATYYGSPLPEAADISAAPKAASVERFVPFPVDALPQPLRSFVIAGARAMCCDRSYLALPMLTAAAAAIGNSRRLQLKWDWLAPPILWVAMVGVSGTVKTAPFKLAMRPIRERQRRAMKRYEELLQEYEKERLQYEKVLLTWKRSKSTDDPPVKPEAPQAERYIVSDTTVEALAPILLANPRGVLLACDELAGWLGSFDRYSVGKGRGDAAHWLSMHNAESIIVDRRTGVPRTIFVPYAAVCVCGGIQPGTLHRALGVEHRESGLAARLLLTCPPRRAKVWTDADIDAAAQAEIVRLFDRLFNLQPVITDDGELCPVVVRLSADAKPAWTAYFNTLNAEQVELDGELAAAWSKLEEYAPRLALVIHFIRWAADDPTLVSPDIVDEVSMRAGITLAEWFKNEARRVYALLAETPKDRDIRRLIEWLERRGGSATARDAFTGCRWLREPGAAEAALEELVKGSHGTWESTPPGQRGQPTRHFRLLRVSSNDLFPEENGITADADSADTSESHGDDGWGDV
jgi:hypothetical protein